MKNLVILSYGNKVEYYRALFTLLSFKAWNPTVDDARMVVYTDDEAFFRRYLEGISIAYRPVAIDEIRAINKVTGYSFRFKIELINRVFAEFPEDDVLYFDTDTYFLGNSELLLGSISARQSVMDEREFTFDEFIEIKRWENVPGFDAQAHPRAFVKLIESKSFKIGEETVTFSKSQYGWNSGVLGISKEYQNYIKDVTALCDDFYVNTEWRTCEQVAFSLVLSHFTELVPSGKSINHYWHYKDRVDPRLERLFTEEFELSPLSRKLEDVRVLTKSLECLLHHETMVTSTKRALREKQIGSGLMYALKAVTSVPLNRDFIEILKYRTRSYSGMVSNKFKSKQRLPG